MSRDTTLDTKSEQFAAGSDGCGGNGEGTPPPVSPGGEAGGTPAAPFTHAEAEALFLGATVRTSYGTGPYIVTKVHGPCHCGHVHEAEVPSDWHVHLTCREPGAKQDSFLNHYRLDGTNVWGKDTITVYRDVPAAAADNDAPPHRVLIKVGDDYYPGQLSAGYAQLGDWRDTPEFDRLVASAIRDGYFQQKVLGKLVKDPATGCDVYEIEDGRHRFWAAQAAQLHHIEGDRTVMPFAELAVRSLCERLHMTKGARAYLVWPLLAPQVEANKEARKAKHLENLKKINSSKKQKGEPTESGLNQLSVEQTLSEIAEDAIPEEDYKSLVKLAAEYGIERTLLDQARRVHEIFARRRDLKVENEPPILAGDLGMGAFLAGIAGREATEGKKRKDADPITLLNRGFKDLTVRWAKWETIPADMQRTAANAAVDHVITSWPPAVLEKLKLALV